jgi:hypothetical protein
MHDDWVKVDKNGRVFSGAENFPPEALEQARKEKRPILLVGGVDKDGEPIYFRLMVDDEGIWVGRVGKPKPEELPAGFTL